MDDNQKISLVLLDVSSIQQYVFGSNKLKENIGGSTLVREIFSSILEDVVNRLFPGKYCLDRWETEPANLQILQNGIEVETGYIGGGNALLLFKNESAAREFIKEWTKTLLIKTPGLKTNVALSGSSIGDIGAGISNCFKILEKNKWQNCAQTVLQRHGITSECRYTGNSVEAIREKEKISSVSLSRFEASKNDHFKEMFKEILGKCFVLPDEFDDLGQSDGESHIAVVHIDGNNVGQRFQEIYQATKGINALIQTRELASSIKKLTEHSMKELLWDIVRKINSELFDEIGIKLKKEGNATILPIRPIVLAGDDVTFVCDGRLGVYCAEMFINKFTSQNISDNKPLAACAGVAVIKTKYPFYRGYQLAEDLCRNAKKKGREKNNYDDASWLDFHVSYGGMSGSLENIRNRRYKTPDNKELWWRPWDIGQLEEIKLIIEYFENKWPQSKLMDLRTALTEGQENSNNFMDMMEKRDLEFPDLPIFTDNQKHDQSPYFDAIELSKFYPQTLLQERQDG